MVKKSTEEQTALKTTMKPADEYVAPAEEKEHIQAIYELQGITDEEKQSLVFNRLAKIIDTPMEKVIPTLIVYEQSEGGERLQGLVNVDSRIIQQAWDFYKTNVAKPLSGEFVQLVCKCTGRQPIIYRRVIQINLL